MHQTFYIDIDEEITSVIDRLRKSKTKENIFVVPKGALMLQSVVNLRLLKKEAEKLKRQIMIVSQDAQGQALAEKVGILVQPTLEGMDEGEEIKEEFKPQIKQQEKIVIEPKRKINRVDDIGSESFFERSKAAYDASVGNFKPTGRKKEAMKLAGEESKIPVKDISNIEPLPKQSQEDTVKGGLAEEKEGKKEFSFPDTGQAAGGGAGIQMPAVNVARFEKEREKTFADVKPSIPAAGDYDYKNAKKLQDFFQLPGEDDKVKQDAKPVNYAPSPIAGKIKKFSIFFGAVSLLVIIAAGAYLMLPKAKIAVQLKSRSQEINLDVKGDSSVSSPDLKEKIIPIRIIEEERESEQSFKTTGKSEISSQKARGTVVIYNEYSTSSQVLIATTRLLASNGKLFRLVKNVTVPGMTKVGGELKPGAVEAEVIADQPGEEYNIDPDTFSIPGFQGTPKYEKFSAKSAKPMAGGGTKGSEVSAVSSEDITLSKEKAEDELIQKVKNEMRSKLQEDEIILDGAVDKTVSELVCSPEAGIVSETVECRVKMKVTAMVFSQKFVEEMINQALNDAKKDSDSNFSAVSTSIGYESPTPDFKNKVLLVKARAKISFQSKVDLEKLKSDLLGKDENQIKELLKSYPNVDSIEVDLWPKFFVEKISTNAKRVEISIK